MDAETSSLQAQADEFFARADSAARSQYPLVVTLWVMLMGLVLMVDPG
jgi:hypothetical protein